MSGHPAAERFLRAAAADDIATLARLLDAGVPVDLRDPQGRSALLIATIQDARGAARALIEAYQNHKEKDSFFNDFFVKLAGTTELRKGIEDGLSSDSIRDQWQEDLNAFKSKREKYLLYD